MAKKIVPTDADERELRTDGFHERGARRVCRAVVSNFEDIGADIGVFFDQSAFRRFTSVAHKEHALSVDIDSSDD